MQKAAAFFGGVCLGGVLSAACGLDLFREDRTPVEEATARLQGELRSSRALLAQSKELLRESDAKLKGLPDRAANREAQFSSVRASGEPARARTEAAALENEVVRLTGELESARKSRAAALAEASRWEVLVRDQVLSFFARERDERDAGLATRYLSSARSKEAQEELILALIKMNKPILMSLPRDASADGGFGAAAVAVPASAHEEDVPPVGSRFRRQ